MSNPYNSNMHYLYNVYAVVLFYGSRFLWLSSLVSARIALDSGSEPLRARIRFDRAMLMTNRPLPMKTQNKVYVQQFRALIFH